MSVDAEVEGDDDGCGGEGIGSWASPSARDEYRADGVATIGFGCCS